LTGVQQDLMIIRKWFAFLGHPVNTQWFNFQFLRFRLSVCSVLMFWLLCLSSQGCNRLRNDLYCVGWGVKLYSLNRHGSIVVSLHGL